MDNFLMDEIETQAKYGKNVGKPFEKFYYQTRYDLDNEDFY